MSSTGAGMGCTNTPGLTDWVDDGFLSDILLHLQDIDTPSLFSLNYFNSLVPFIPDKHKVLPPPANSALRMGTAKVDCTSLTAHSHHPQGNMVQGTTNADLVRRIYLMFCAVTV